MESPPTAQQRTKLTVPLMPPIALQLHLFPLPAPKKPLLLHVLVSQPLVLVLQMMVVHGKLLLVQIKLLLLVLPLMPKLLVKVLESSVLMPKLVPVVFQALQVQFLLLV